MLNETIKKLRTDKNMTQLQLGEILGVSEKTVSKWELGDTAIPSEKLPFIADTFGVNIDRLFCHFHDNTSDILNSVTEYMRSIPSENAISAAQHIASYIVLGAELREMSDSGCYSPSDIDEIEGELRQLILQNDSRRQSFFHCPEKKDNDYQNGGMENYTGEDLKLTVFQKFTDESFKQILDSYAKYGKVFEFLAMPDAVKLLKYRYSTQMPEYFTVEYISAQSGASKQTVEMFLDINCCNETAEYVTIQGKNEIMYSKPVTCGAQSILQTVIVAAYAFAVKRKEGHR